MKAFEARNLFTLFNSDGFSWEGISEDNSISLLQMMMQMSEINESLAKAEEFAKKQIVVGRLKELVEKFNAEDMIDEKGFTQKATSDKDFEEYKKIVAEADLKLGRVLEPKMMEDVHIGTLDKSAIAQIISANALFFQKSKVKPFTLYLLLTRQEEIDNKSKRKKK